MVAHARFFALMVTVTSVIWSLPGRADTMAQLEQSVRAEDASAVAELRRTDPEAATWLEQAHAARTRGDSDRAAQLYAKVRERRPDDADVLRRSCYAEVAAGRRAEGIALCEKAARDGSPKNLAGYAQMLAEPLKDGSPAPKADRESALVLAKRAAKDGSGPWPQIALARAASINHDWASVDAAVRELKSQGHPEAAALCLATRALARLPEGDPEGAMSKLTLDAARRDSRAALQLGPGSVDVQRAAAVVAMATGDVAGLEQASRALVRLAPEEPGPHAYRAIALASSGEWDDAFASLERAREHGLDEQRYAELKQSLEDERPTDWVGLVLWLFGGWFGTWLVLIVLGVALSNVALRAAREPVTEQSGRATGMASQLRRAYAAVLWLCRAFYYLSMPLVALLVIGLVAALVGGMLLAGAIPIKLLIIVVLVGGGTLLAMLRALFVRTEDEDPGSDLDLAQHPRLRAVLHEVAERVGTRPVDRVFLSPGTDVAVFERGGVLKQMRGHSERCLILGAGVLKGMPERQFKSILAHEYGHFRNEDTAGGGFALAVRRSLITFAMGMARAGGAGWYNPAWLFVNAFHRVFLIISHGASRLQEVLADRWAAFAYGGEAFVGGLKHVVERSVRFDAHVSATIGEVVDRRVPLTNLYTYEPSEPVDPTEVDAAIEAAMNEQSSHYDSHPAPRERIELVRALAASDPDEPTAGEGDDAWALLEDTETVELMLTAQVRTNVFENVGLAIAGPAAAE